MQWQVNTGLMLHSRVISHTTAAVCEAEDSTGRRWALKRVPEDNQSVREAERLVKLQGHPLIVPLESVFVDRGITYLQMPFYQRGNLRTWVEQMKVRCLKVSVIMDLHMHVTALNVCVRMLHASKSYTCMLQYMIVVSACK